MWVIPTLFLHYSYMSIPTFLYTSRLNRMCQGPGQPKENTNFWRMDPIALDKRGNIGIIKTRIRIILVFERDVVCRNMQRKY